MKNKQNTCFLLSILFGCIMIFGIFFIPSNNIVLNDSMISPKAAADDIYEPNNNIPSAKTLTIGKHSLIMNMSDTYDFFKFTLTVGKFHVYIDWENDSLNLNPKFYNSSSQQIANSMFSMQSYDYLTIEIVSDGDYYLEIKQISPLYEDLPYNLSTKLDPDDNFEPNNNFASAYPITESDMTNLKCFDDDYYKITVPSGKRLDITTTGSDAQDLDIWIMFINFTLITSSETQGSSNEHITWTNPSSTSEEIVIRVFFFGEFLEDSYTFGVKIEDPSSSTTTSSSSSSTTSTTTSTTTSSSTTSTSDDESYEEPNIDDGKTAIDGFGLPIIIIANLIGIMYLAKKVNFKK